MTATYDWLCKMLVAEYKIDPSRLLPDAPLEDLGIDSLGMAELLFNVEDEFGITLPPEPVNLPTVGHVVRFIDVLIVARKAAQDAPTEAVTEPFPASAAVPKPDPA
ncbi:MAG: acyl carrier protein [Polaromonas sp.]